MVHRYPEVLEQDVVREEVLDDEDVFRAYLTSQCMPMSLGKVAYRIEHLVGKFSVGIRGTPS